MHRQDPLQELAELSGVELHYQDNEGQLQVASEEALLKVLQALGVPISSPEEAEALIEKHHDTTWRQVLEPFQVLWDGTGSLMVRLPESANFRSFRWEMLCEDGFTIRGKGTCSDLPLVTTGQVKDKTYVLRKLIFSEPLPTGYGEFRFHLGGRRYRATVAIAPTMAYRPTDSDKTEPHTKKKKKRRWGIFAPLYSLHRDGRSSLGDLGDLEDITRWVASQGGDVVGTLPLLASFLDNPCIPSPYAPVSRLYWNEVFLDLDTIPEWQNCPRAQQLMGRGPEESLKHGTEDDPLSDHSWINYRTEMATKRQALEAMLLQLESTPSDRREAFYAFAKQDKKAARYAGFRAISEKRQQPWVEWPKSLRGGSLRKSAFKAEVQRYHLYVQWVLRQQLERLSESSREKGLGLYLDLALGVHPYGYDTWQHQGLFASKVATGAPPDPLFQGGQNWGFPPLHPDRLLDSKYDYVIASLRNHMQYAGVLRIDHVMGLHRLYWIPDGMGAKEGVYVRYRPEHFYAILSIESHRNHTLLIGEDLGTVEPGVRETMHKHSIQRMTVLPFPQQDSPRPVPHAVASLNTHDMPMFASLWTGKDIADRQELGWYTDEQVEQEQQARAETCTKTVNYLHQQGWLEQLPDTPYPASPSTIQAVYRACLRYLASSESRLLMITLEDLWQETRSQNIPGTGDEQHPNWRGRARYPLETIIQENPWQPLLQEIRQLREQDVPESLRCCVPPDFSTSAELPVLLASSSEPWGDLDDYFFSEGTHDRLYEKLGAHPDNVGTQQGIRFRVWAPHAQHVSVVGDFNQWNSEANPLEACGSYGIWEGFVPKLTLGQLYKYNIVPQWGGEAKHKFDPVGFFHEKAPHTASLTWELSYEWHDEGWLKERGGRIHLKAPISIYEVHLGSWMRDPKDPERLLSYREIAPKLADYAVEMGFTHIELLPVMEHPFYGSWGYQCTGYFAPSHSYGTPQDLMYLVDTLHQRNVGVILDWVPSHFPQDDYALAQYDGTPTYEYADPRKGYHTDWTSNIFDYGRGPVQSFLLSSALFWLEHYHIDGLRVDGVASMLYLDYSRESGEWLPNIYGGRENLEAVEFLRRFNSTVYRRFPDVQTFAEESTSWPKVSRPVYEDGLGFGLKWDMGWMHDTLEYLKSDPIYRKHHHHNLTFRMLYAFHENFVLALSHDEVVHGKGSLLDKMPGDHWRSLAQLRLLYGYMFGMPGKKLLFMGQEFGMGREWDHDSSIDWHLLAYEPHRGLQRWVTDMNQLYRSHRSLHTGDCLPSGFEWIEADDADNSVYCWLRHSTDNDDPPLLICCNFTPVPRYGYRVGVPQADRWNELANSDAQIYGGSGEGNLGGVEAEPIPSHQWPQSIELTLPPFGVVYLSSKQ